MMININDCVQIYSHSRQINLLSLLQSATGNRINSPTFTAVRLATDRANSSNIAPNQILAATSMLNPYAMHRVNFGQVRPAFADNTTNSGFQHQEGFMFTPIYPDSVVRLTEDTWVWKVSNVQERTSMY